MLLKIDYSPGQVKLKYAPSQYHRIFQVFKSIFVNTNQLYLLN
jgi:hypothetical protein